MSVRLEDAIALIERAQEERSGLEHRVQAAASEIHQLKRRLQSAQDENRDLQDRYADLELRLGDAERRAENAVSATLSHAARTG